MKKEFITLSILSSSLISTPEGIETGFLATLDMIKKPRKLLHRQYFVT